MAGCAARHRALFFLPVAVAAGVAAASAPASLRVRRLNGLPSANETAWAYPAQGNYSDTIGAVVKCKGVLVDGFELAGAPCGASGALPLAYAEEMPQHLASFIPTAPVSPSEVDISDLIVGTSHYVLTHYLELFESLLAAWLLLELAFYAWYHVQLRRANVPSPPPRVTAEDREWIWSKVLEHALHHTLWRQLQGWFLAQDPHSHGEVGRLPCSHEEIGHDNMLELMAWAFCYKRMEDLDGEEREWVLRRGAEAAKDLAREGKALPPGRTGVTCMRHTLDPVQSLHRPLLFYVFVGLADALHGCLLRLQGFRRCRHGGLSYWYRAPAMPAAAGQDEGEELPLAFFHGIGFGLCQYLPLIFGLRQQKIFLFELPWIAMVPLARVPSSSEYSDWVVEAMEAHGVRQFVPLGHSFGSLAVAWLVRRHPDRVPRCMLVDPVAVFLNLPDVCANFLYAAPWDAFGNLIRFVAAREFGVARCLSRHFFWSECVLFPEMLPSGSSLTLMGKDHILPAEVIREGSAGLPGLRTHMMPEMDHGLFLFSLEALDCIFDEIDAVCRGGPKPPEAEDSPRGWRAATSAWAALGAAL